MALNATFNISGASLNANFTGAAAIKGEQAKTVALSMASGDQSISPDSGKVLSGVTVQKPATMIAGNIKKDVDIGGVVGTLNDGVPIEVSTDAGMTAVLIAANVGKAYKFTGTTGTYTNGNVYIVEAS